MIDKDRSKVEETVITPEELEVIKRVYQEVFQRDPGPNRNPKYISDPDNIHYDPNYPDVVEIEGLVAVFSGYTNVTRESITGSHTFQERCWFVEGMKYYPATHWEPEDIDYYPISEHESLESAISSAFKVIIQEGVKCSFDNIAGEKQAKEWKEEKVS